MKFKIIIYSILLIVINMNNPCFSKSVKRVRNEGTFYLPASNVMGNGNISVYSQLKGRLTSKLLEAIAELGVGIGLAEILQFKIQTSFINFNELGPSEMHLQATLPGNDQLRFFGIAISSDLYLSTSIDTIDQEADITKPKYNPYLLASIIVDLDLVSRINQFPIKIYTLASLLDNPRLLFEYKQLALKGGFELKMLKNSMFVDGGIGLYKERHAKGITRPKFDQIYGWISPGIRYRVLNRFSILGNFRWTIFRKTNRTGSLNPEKILFSLKFEAPIIFKETNTEAIRTLVFLEKIKKDNDKRLFSQDTKSKNMLLDKFESGIFDSKEKEETFDYKKEKKTIIKRREKVKAKMEEIEELLKDEDDEK